MTENDVTILMSCHCCQVRRREEEEMERERQSELELRKEADELAKNETKQIMSIASELAVGKDDPSVCVGYYAHAW